MIRIGIVGSGFGLYGLLPAFQAVNNCTVVSICGRKTERLIMACREIGLNNIYYDWRTMIDKERLDAVALAVRPNSQYEIAKVAIEKGIHIFAEKPLAVTYIQAKDLLDRAKKKKITHAVDFIFPEIDEWVRVKQLIDSSVFGRLEHISVNWDFLSYDIQNGISSWKTDVSEGGGALSFYFSHALYYLEYFAGEILHVQSLFSYSKESISHAEVGLDLLLRFKNEINGYAHIRCNSKGLIKHQLLFQFERGSMILENENDIVNNFVVRMYELGKKEKVWFLKKVYKNNEDERVPFVARLAGRFIHACLAKRQMKPSFAEAVRVQKLIQIIRSKREAYDQYRKR